MTRNSLRFFLVLLFAWPLLANAAPRAWLDRDSMRLGETVTLNVETDIRGAEPDFSPLNASFRVLGTSSSSQISIVNGHQTAKTLWAVALEPTVEGVIGLPPLKVGNETTQALTLTVLPAPAGGSAAQGDDVFMETDAQPANPYVQQQVRYTVRLYYAVTLLEGQLEEPRADAGQVRRLGQDLTYQKTVAGRRYNVVERRYALIPESSGHLTIAGPQFRGRALQPGQFNSMFGAGVNLSERGDEVALEVRPRPVDAPSPWLPAQTLELVDESGTLPSDLQLGEPLTLTVRLTAQGLAAEQLPELVLPRIGGAEVYPDQETTQTRDDGEWLRGERVRKFAVVPTRTGEITIPEIAIEWWNTASDRRERAVLPARRVLVAGGAASSSPAAPAAAAAPDTTDTGRAVAQPTTERSASSVARPWQIATAVLAAMWLLSLVLLWRSRRPAPAPRQAPAALPRSTPDAWRRDWRHALAANDLPQVARALLQGAQAQRVSLRDLGTLATALEDAGQRDAVVALERALYRGDVPQDLPARLERAFERPFAWRTPAPRAANDDILPPLYS